ncbi:glycosyltransferase [Patescibacteria group bacterium]|nr:glycosyltransferase [Patescibacteria group bacterium]MBU1868567.1 glycosyltransferase [Patescibacteria group bacterium]
MKLTILAEIYHKSHFQAFHRLYQNGLVDKLEIINLGNLVKKPSKIPVILYSLLAELFRPNYVIVGSAPLSPLVLYYLLLKLVKRNKIVNYTSWPYWNENRYRWSFLVPIFRPLWEVFLRDLTIVALNSAAYTSFAKYSDKTHLIPHSVDTNIFKPLDVDKNEKFTCLFVGKLQERKGIRYILKAAQKLKEIEFWLVGEGPLHSEIKKLALVNVKLLGYVSGKNELARIYNQCHLFMLPSYKTEKWEELFGVVIIEAMACRLPVIATDCSGPGDLIESQKEGFLIKQRSTNDLIDKISYLKENDDLRKSMGEKGHAKVMTEYSDIHVANKIAEIIESFR